jgi:hypothetical protein
MLEFHKPFTVKDGKIWDRDGKYVRLWGVNYYAPFNHNYVNLEELGVDPYRAIDRDIEDFKRIGVNLVRMHCYDREISDQDGHLAENERLRVFDYLIYRLEQEGIYVMITPIVWFNTVELETELSASYAVWSIHSSETFGFSNFYTAHEMIWNEDAIRAQETYLNEFFSHRSAFSGKRLSEYDHIVIVEIINEALYPTAKLIDQLRDMKTSNPYRLQERKLVDLYEAYCADGAEDCDESKRKFCAGLLLKYLERTFSVVDRCFGGSVVKTHIYYGFWDPDIFEALQKAPINAVSVTAYTPENFGSSHNDHLNPLPMMRQLWRNYQPLKKLGKALVCYEFDMPSNLQGYYMAAFGQFLAALGVQAAAHFTYTPLDVAAYNPGWLVHYFNLRHTPSKGAAFLAGKHIFSAVKPGSALPENDDVWEGEGWRISRSEDSVWYLDDDRLIAHGKNSPADLRNSVAACGSIPLVERSGNGFWTMEKCAEGWSLTVLPSQKYVNDPFRGRLYNARNSGMANRYVNCNREWAVSRLQERPDTFVFRFDGIASVVDEQGREIQPENGGYRLYAGNYRIVME